MENVQSWTGFRRNMGVLFFFKKRKEHEKMFDYEQKCKGKKGLLSIVTTEQVNSMENFNIEQKNKVELKY